MKKLFITLFVLTMLLPLTGCKKNEDEKKLSININQVASELLAKDDFKLCKLVDTEKYALKFGALLDSMEEGVFAIPSGAETANMFIIAKAKEGKEADLYAELNIIVVGYDGTWTKNVYNAAEAKKVQDRLVKKVDGYYICIISNDNQSVYDIITK